MNATKLLTRYCVILSFIILSSIIFHDLVFTSAHALVNGKTYFVHASSLNVRKNPDINSDIVGSLRANTTVRLLSQEQCFYLKSGSCAGISSWCRVVTERYKEFGDVEGYVACAYLQQLRLEYKRLNVQMRHLVKTFGDRMGRTQKEFDRAFNLMERLIALNPSTPMFRRYERLLTSVYPNWKTARDTGDNLAMAKRIKTYHLMLKKYTRLVKAKKKPRRSKAYYKESVIRSQKTEEQDKSFFFKPVRPSLFKYDSDITGWASGFNAECNNDILLGGGRYCQINIGAHTNIKSLSHVLQLSGIRPLIRRYELFGMDVKPKSILRAASLENDVEAYVINTTRYSSYSKAFFRAQVMGVYDHGGKCTRDPSKIELVTDDFGRTKSVGQGMPGLFATSRNIDADDAKIETEELHYREDGRTLVDVEFYNLDIDGDGIADLRGGNVIKKRIDSSTGTPRGYVDELNEADGRLIYAVMGDVWNGNPPSGWYADNKTWMEANINGTWKLISEYRSLPRCPD